jgi:hypothetical protein
VKGKLVWERIPDFNKFEVWKVENSERNVRGI